VDVDDPVKFSLLTLTNDAEAARNLSVFAYNDWVLARRVTARPGTS
jgi:cellobiose phosphorylase